MNINQVLKEEIAKISVSGEDVLVLEERAREIIQKLKEQGRKAYLGGSLAKGTLINKKFQDIDIFVVFDNQNQTLELENILKKAKLNAERVHGSRDYFKIKQGSVIFELIPVLEVKDPRNVENVTDFSLLHVEYVKKKIKKNKKIQDEIKLAKTFCHAQDCYGAESYIKGFSGYALELLVLHYGGFVKMLKALVRVKKQIVIDPERQFKGNALTELNEAKILSPIVLIDPTYKFRNVTAGLSKETFESFVKSAELFLKKPNISFFEVKTFNVEAFKKLAKSKKASFIEIKLTTEKQEGDIAGTKMKKFFEFICKALENKQQEIIGKHFDYADKQDASGYLIVKENKEIIVKGPSLKLEEPCKKFKFVHKKTIAKAGFLYTKKKITLKEIFQHLHGFEEEMAVRFFVK